MKRFRKILIVFQSGSDNDTLLEHALTFAKTNCAEIKVVDIVTEPFAVVKKEKTRKPAEESLNIDLSIIEELPLSEKSSVDCETPDLNCRGDAGASPSAQLEILEYIEKETQRALQPFITKIEAAGIKVSSQTLHGTPFISIIREVLRNQHDLVMITAENTGDVKISPFGSTSLHLMRKCPCPVWVIKPGQTKPFKRILATLDLVQDDQERGNLALKIMQLSTSLAEKSGSELILVHAWQLFGESILRGRAGFSKDEIETYLKETREIHRKMLVEFLHQHAFDHFKSQIYLLKGEPENVIPELAKVKEIDLIVMGTVSRSGISGLFIGNTAEKVIQQVNCSLLTVKPEGFVSPVKMDGE